MIAVRGRAAWQAHRQPILGRSYTLACSCECRSCATIPIASCVRLETRPMSHCKHYPSAPQESPSGNFPDNTPLSHQSGLKSYHWGAPPYRQESFQTYANHRILLSRERRNMGILSPLDLGTAGAYRTTFRKSGLGHFGRGHDALRLLEHRKSASNVSLFRDQSWIDLLKISCRSRGKCAQFLEVL